VLFVAGLFVGFFLGYLLAALLIVGDDDQE
jgi:hypothetical protein